MRYGFKPCFSFANFFSNWIQTCWEAWGVKALRRRDDELFWRMCFSISNLMGRISPLWKTIYQVQQLVGQNWKTNFFPIEWRESLLKSHWFLIIMRLVHNYGTSIDQGWSSGDDSTNFCVIEKFILELLCLL
jgi:hypothetical protein